MSKNCLIVTALESDIPIVQRIAAAAWKPTYGEILSVEQQAYMLAWMYDTERLRQQMQDGVVFLLLKNEGTFCGFAAYEVFENQHSKLHKLYFDPAEQGKGLGKILLEEVCQQLKKCACTSVELNVNRYNKSSFFYQKMGFVTIREEDIDVGENYFMNDFVMKKDL